LIKKKVFAKFIFIICRSAWRLGSRLVARRTSKVSTGLGRSAGPSQKPVNAAGNEVKFGANFRSD
jgi:hypothetical protein